MTRRGFLSFAVGLLAICLGAFAGAASPDTPGSAAAILGTRPSYGPSSVDDTPNAAAVVKRIWSPGLDAGYDPQGLAVAGDTVLVSAYRSELRQQHRGPCRLFRLDARSGNELGHFDVPPPCGHAGGVAVGPGGHVPGGLVYLSDTHTLFAVPGPAGRLRAFPLGPGLVGGLAASSPGAIWLGTYNEAGQGRLFRFDAARLATLKDGEPLTVSDSTAQLPIPSYAQGAAFDADGRLWVARSDTRWGELVLLNPATGAMEGRFATAPGIEGIAFGADGLLWAVSEAGARHSYDSWWARYVVPFYPLVFALDTRRLQ